MAEPIGVAWVIGMAPGLPHLFMPIIITLILDQEHLNFMRLLMVVCSKPVMQAHHGMT